MYEGRSEEIYCKSKQKTFENSILK